MRERKHTFESASSEDELILMFQKIYEKLEDSEYFTLGDIVQNKFFNYKNVKPLKLVFKTFVKKGLVEEVERRGRFRFTSEVLKKLKLNGTKMLSSTDEDEIIKSYRDDLEEEIKSHKRFIITTAVMGKEVNKAFLSSLKCYAKETHSLILILPCEDVASRGRKAAPIELNQELSGLKVIFKDTYLNNNLCLCAIKTSAKQINPLSGLDRLPVAKKASIIVASPKVFLKYIPNLHYDIPPALMTTGAITVNNYDTDKYMSKRTAYLAENDHTYGAVIVEIENDEIFHFRHVQASEDGSFTDLGMEFSPDGSMKVTEGNAIVVGDSHVGYHDKELHDEIIKLAKDVNVKEVVLHDIFHGSSVSHHDVGKGITNAIKAKEGKLGLERECEAVKNYLTVITNEGFSVTVVKSNHDNHLLRYLQEGRYISDPINYYFSLKLAVAATEGKDPLQFALEHELEYQNDNVKWLNEDVSYKIYGVEIGTHGSIGANGCKGSLAVFEKGLGNCVTAHTHSAAIIRSAYCVGTVGMMDMKYNKGLSSWTRTCCLIYSNGTKQLINFIPNSRGAYSCSV